MERPQVKEWGWIVRTQKPVLGQAQADLNECFGATIVVTSIQENGDVVGVVLPGGPHDTNGRGGQFVLIRVENLTVDFFEPDPRLHDGYTRTEAA